MNTYAVHCFVEGLVQGVGFRHATYRQATHLGLSGWVRNLPDGRVEIDAHGDRATLEQFLEWVHQGPALARVENVSVEWADSITEPGPFEIRFRGD